MQYVYIYKDNEEQLYFSTATKCAWYAGNKHSLDLKQQREMARALHRGNHKFQDLYFTLAREEVISGAA